MSASENQAAEANKDTSARRIGPPGNKIRIRLPPRKRLSEGLTMTTGVAEDSKNSPAQKVPAHTDNNTQKTIFVDTNVKVEEASRKSQKEGLCVESNSNSLSKTLSQDTLPKKANFIVASLSLKTATGVQAKEEKTYPERKEPCDEGNKNVLSKGLRSENSSNTSMKESCVGAIENIPSKDLSVTEVQGLVEKNNSITRPCEDVSNNILSKRILYEANRSSKGVPEEAEVNDRSKNLITSATVKCEETNNISAGNSLFEEAINNIATAKVSTEATNSALSRRPSDPTNDMKSSKKLCTTAVHATDISQNTSVMELSCPVYPALEQSTSTADLEATKEYEEFEEKVKGTVYLDSLSLVATKEFIYMALNQFGSVRNVNFLVNYTVPYDIPQSALVEMETEKDAESVVNVLHEFPFMISGMPRPVRVKRATAEMFNDRPRRPGRNLEFNWVGPTHPDCQSIRKYKLMCKRHEVENLALIKHQLEQEKLLAKQQQDILDSDYRKLETIGMVIRSGWGWVDHLSRIYSIRFDEVY